MKSSRFIAAAAVIGLALCIGPAIAQTPAPEPVTTVAVGKGLADILIAYAAVVGTIVSALASWVMLRVTGIRLDAEARSAIETFATNAAGSFLKNFDSLKGVTIDARNPTIAALAQGALDRVPDALARFKLGPNDIAQRIAEKIGVLTAATPDVPPPTPAG